MPECLEDQLLKLLGSDPHKEWKATEIERKLPRWDSYLPNPKYRKNYQLAVCVSLKLKEDGLVSVWRTGEKGPFVVQLTERGRRHARRNHQIEPDAKPASDRATR